MIENGVFVIRHATKDDLEQLSELESLCFPKNEAASKECIRKRLEVYSDFFWILEHNDIIISMVDGIVTDCSNLYDEMYIDTSFHNTKGLWQMIFGVETRPEYRCKGYAEILLRKVISDAKSQKRKGIVLTCKDKLIPFYGKFGFKNEGISESTHGDEIWYQMKLEL